MHKYMKYIIRREWIIFLMTVITTAILFYTLKVDVVADYLGKRNGDMLKGFIAFAFGVFIVDRTSIYIDKSMIFGENNYLMMVPISVAKRINAVLIVTTVMLITYVAAAMTFAGGSVSDKLDIFFLVPMFAITFTLMACYSLYLVSRIIKNRTNALIALGFMTTAFIVVAIIVFSYYDLSLPFFYNIRTAVISTCVTLSVLSYMGLVYAINIGDNLKPVRNIVAAILLCTIILNGSVQGYTYANRVVDDITYTFETDSNVIGDWWYYDTLTSEGVTMTMAIDSIGDDALLIPFRHNNFFAVYDDGTTNDDFVWTKGYFIDEKLGVKRAYCYVEKEGIPYLVVEVKGNDYVYNNGPIHYTIYQKAKQ